VDASALGFLVARQDDVPGDFGEVEGFPLLDSLFAACQCEQRLDEAFLLLAPAPGRPGSWIAMSRRWRLDRRVPLGAGSARR